MATHSSTLAWKIPWTEEPGKLQSMGSLRVWHDWATSLHFSLSCTGGGNGNPLQCSCLGNPGDGGPGGLPSLGSHRVRHDWNDLAAAAVVKNSSANAGELGDVGSIPESGRSPRGGNDNTLQYSPSLNSMNRGNWWATVHEVAKSQTLVKWPSTAHYESTVLPYVSR